MTALAIGATGAGAATYSSPAPIAIPATGTANPYPSQITVSGHAPPISDLNVNLTSFSHGSPSDVRTVLVGPGGQALLLMACSGGEGSPDPPAIDVGLKFDDSSGIRLAPTGGGLTSGTYKPTYHCGNFPPSFPPPGPLTNYSNPGPDAGGAATLAQVFNGTSANGTWSLFASDDFTGVAGEFAGGWSLEISPDPAPAKKKCKKGRKLKKGKCVKKKKKKRKKK